MRKRTKKLGIQTQCRPAQFFTRLHHHSVWALCSCMQRKVSCTWASALCFLQAFARARQSLRTVQHHGAAASFAFALFAVYVYSKSGLQAARPETCRNHVYCELIQVHNRGAALLACVSYSGRNAFAFCSLGPRSAPDFKMCLRGFALDLHHPELCYTI